VDEIHQSKIESNNCEFIINAKLLCLRFAVKLIKLHVKNIKLSRLKGR
jgi:hypothetical protein